MGFGTTLAAGQDLNGDGTPDFVVGANGVPFVSDPNSRDGSVFAYSGRNGSLLYRLNAEAGSDAVFGVTVSLLGDINGDGKSEFAVGAYRANASGRQRPGTVTVRSGADGSIIYTLAGETNNAAFGITMASLGDVNGDGKGDFIVGANPSGDYKLYGYSGADGTQLYTTSAARVRGIHAMGDLSGDGAQDFAVSTLFSPSHYGRVLLKSGANGQQLGYVEVPQAEMNASSVSSDARSFGESVSSIDDLNGDGIPEIIIGAPDTRIGFLPTAGYVVVLSGADRSPLHQFNVMTSERVGVDVD